jgi:hypothetical protein
VKTTFWCNHESGFYFRVLGYGLAVERDMPMLFSERNGYRRALRIGRWAAQMLTPLNSNG